MDDPREEVGVGARGHLDEEVARHGGQRRPRGHLRTVEQHARHARRGVEDRLEEHPAPAADVDDRAEHREVVRRDDGGGFPADRSRIDAWNAPTSSGCAARWVKNRSPWTDSNGTPPERTAERRPPNAA